MNNAGRIGFLIKGDYDSTATYDFLDVVFYDGASYVANTLTIGNQPERSNEYWQVLAEGGTLTEKGDISETTIDFEEAENRVNVVSGETASTFAGKVRKWFADLGAAAFHAVANNLTTTQEGFLLDARMGKELADKYDELNSAKDIINKNVSSIQSGLDNKIPYLILNYAGNEENALNIINNPTLHFGRKHTPYCIIFAATSEVS